MRIRAGVRRGGHFLAPSAVLAAAGLAACAATGIPAQHPPQATGPAPASATATPAPSAAASTPGVRGRLPQQQAIGAIGGYQVATLSLRLTDRSRLQARPRVLPTSIWYPAQAGSLRPTRRWAFPARGLRTWLLQCASSDRPLLSAWASGAT